jgi:iron complex transport system ATP-binding protein
VSFGYGPGAPEVFSGLDLAVPEGVPTAVLGPNGCGKTTLLRLLLGVERPGAGEIWLEGRRAESYGRRERARTVGWVPQTEHIPFDFSLADYVLLGRAPYLHPLAMPGRGDEERARAALSRVGLGAMAERPVTRLSGGEQQLAAIARALAQNPRVLLLDEPTSHLDLANRRAVVEVLAGLSAEGVTLVFTTHDPQLAAAAARNLVLMKRGRVLASGALEELFTSENLSEAYGVPVEVVRAGGRVFAGV